MSIFRKLSNVSRRCSETRRLEKDTLCSFLLDESKYKHKVFYGNVSEDVVTGCWIWNGSVNTDGYGTFRFSYGRYILAHRLSYSIYNGASFIERGLDVHHTCKNKLCVNPRHLVALSSSEHNKYHIRSMCVKQTVDMVISMN